MWIRMAWHDGRLVWDPDDYGGMVNMTIKAEDVWRPDMLLYDNVDQGFGGWPVDVVRVSNNGTVIWSFPKVLSTSCDVDVSGFPFDAQRCHFTFGSWMHDTSMIRIDDTVKDGNLMELRESAEWDTRSFHVGFRTKTYDGLDYDEVTFHLAMKRKWSFYFFNLLFPCFLLALLATLSFYLPAESGDKVSFGVTVLLALAVFLLMIAEDMPPSESMPLIGWYVIVTLVLLSLSLLLGSIVVNLSICTADTTPVPAWVRRLVLRYMSQVLFMGDLSGSLVVDQEQKSVEIGKSILNDGTLQVPQINEKNDVEEKEPEGKRIPFDGRMEELLELVRIIARRLEEEREGEALEDDWKRVARVLDKFFMVLYLLTSVTVIVYTCVNGLAG
ncbi:neuronal acetylcholine receptor subunit alpha-9-like [Branchiostoma lanceolatum]|uniref:neuronal acetylcholine receptor subunit alpha-9-like n=1 Tax=Branchiostoma lanceolatum TaxID=7740 RepID=UPI003455DBEB